MKKRQILLFLTVSVLLCLLYAYYSHGRIQVTFQYEDGRIHETVKVARGSPIPMPTDPSQKNHIFVGWYTNPANGEKADLSQGVKQDTVLYAKFRLDAAAVINDITKTIMKSLVKIECRTYNTESGSYTSAWTQGSGFCYSAGNDYYYILTNCHAVCKSSENENVEIRIYDYQGTKYWGYLYNDPNKKGDAISADHDLACVYFCSDSSDVTPLSIVNDNPHLESEIIALGAPHAQMNSITFGKVLAYQEITLHDTPAYSSNVKFPVFCHSAETGGGSSGGPILNTKLQVVGVHFAGAVDVSIGYAIPAEKIWDFLQQYVK